MADRMAAWSPGGVLAVTKFHVPARRPGLVERAALVGLLAGDRHAKLALISAPPGAGKTTLLAEWCASPEEDRRFAWLSLDPEDADPVRFWGCVVTAIRTLHPGFGERTLGALRSAHGRLVDVVVPLLVNEAAELPEDTVLVLDDLHVIDELPARQREVIVLRDVQGWDAEEVCHALDISEGNQRVLLHRARAKVRETVERTLGGEA